MTYYNVLGNFLNCYSPIATESNECVLCECITQLAIVVLLHIVYFNLFPLSSDQCSARMEILGLWMEVLLLRVVWSYAGMRPGVLCVMDSGQVLMHKWPADS